MGGDPLQVPHKSLFTIRDLFMMMPGNAAAPDGMEKPHQGGNQQDAHRDGPGDAKGMQP